MNHLTSPQGVNVSLDTEGAGPPLVLVHGSFTDHNTNWDLVRPLLERQFTVYAVARRGRGETTATRGHRVEDEGKDVATVIRSIDEPVFLLGHSYGAQVALAAALQVPDRVRKLVLYEPPSPDIHDDPALQRLDELAAASDWETFAATFFREVLSVPAAELNDLRESPSWPPIVADAQASLGDIRALTGYRFEAADFRALHLPVMLQVGTESPRERFVTGGLAAALPDACIDPLPGQAHEGMTTAPGMYADAVTRFLLNRAGAAACSCRAVTVRRQSR